MRKNFPITQDEVRVRADQYLISKTDLKGRITYANAAFIAISGFTREELIGKAHNLSATPTCPPRLSRISGIPCKASAPGWAW